MPSLSIVVGTAYCGCKFSVHEDFEPSEFVIAIDDFGLLGAVYLRET